eukprot:CAMPEP_0204830762 /NCGR_PEP_ID=MMETSP1346-20131115/9230_1 /ASSEMBLY_ACC=CAM_ASM_000771 /TAXON_ID=215587 /ORGANISM="Aplanochytrium stocchinoi, Strain GSBS06" /LENGTH=273 /DNA_ID=CAMNT_0051961279 /DNA_START=298 /DNA_END=1119 /DNA_ORIENTATION=-
MVPIIVDAKQTITEAVRGMADKDSIRSAIMVEDKQTKKVVGIITERDYARKVELQGKDPNTTLCEEIMTPAPETIETSESLDDAITALFQGSYRHLPITDRDSVSGMLGINDTLRELFRLQVLHKHMPAMKAPLTAIPNGPSKAKTHFVDETDDVYEAIKLMSIKDVGSLVVKNNENVMTGIITEHDYLAKVAMKGASAKDMKVSEIMTKDPVCTEASKSVLKGLELLIGQGCRHMPLLGPGTDADGPLHKESGLRVVGMLSSKHIIRYVYDL